MEFSFGITPTELTAGDYWVGFVLNMANNFPAGYEADYYWANTSNGDGIFKALLTSQLNPNGTWTAGPANQNLAFAVDSAVPLPAALPLFASGLVWVGLAEQAQEADGCGCLSELHQAEMGVRAMSKKLLVAAALTCLLGTPASATSNRRVWARAA